MRRRRDNHNNTQESAHSTGGWHRATAFGGARRSEPPFQKFGGWHNQRYIIPRHNILVSVEYLECAQRRTLRKVRDKVIINSVRRIDPNQK